MSLPNEDPSNPGLPAPLFADVDAVRGDQLRANNQLIYENETYLDEGQNINDADAATPADGDSLGFFQAAGAIIKKVTLANFFLWIMTKVNALSSKTTPVGADKFLINDSEASGVGKTVSFTDLKATLAAAGLFPAFWVNFNGQGGTSIRSSYNVSSITNNGTGDYTINFANALPNANFAVNVSISSYYGSGLPVIAIATNGLNAEVAPTTTSIRIRCTDTGATGFDPKYVSVIGFAAA